MHDLDFVSLDWLRADHHFLFISIEVTNEYFVLLLLDNLLHLGINVDVVIPVLFIVYDLLQFLFKKIHSSLMIDLLPQLGAFLNEFGRFGLHHIVKDAFGQLFLDLVHEFLDVL